LPLRGIVDGLRSHETRLYRLGTRPVRRSTLADANAERPAAVFPKLFAAMVGCAHRGLRRKMGEGTYPIDATGIRLTGRGCE